jgi:hypothetical protein
MEGDVDVKCMATAAPILCPYTTTFAKGYVLKRYSSAVFASILSPFSEGVPLLLSLQRNEKRRTG